VPTPVPLLEFQVPVENLDSAFAFHKTDYLGYCNPNGAKKIRVFTQKKLEKPFGRGYKDFDRSKNPHPERLHR
jgi:hypothetical protein